MGRDSREPSSSLPIIRSRPMYAQLNFEQMSLSQSASASNNGCSSGGMTHISNKSNNHIKRQRKKQGSLKSFLSILYAWNEPTRINLTTLCLIYRLSITYLNLTAELLAGQMHETTPLWWHWNQTQCLRSTPRSLLQSDLSICCPSCSAYICMPCSQTPRGDSRGTTADSSYEQGWTEIIHDYWVFPAPENVISPWNESRNDATWTFISMTKTTNLQLP